MTHAPEFAATFITLYAAHLMGDHWIQTHEQALVKACVGWSGRLAAARHVATMTATKLALLALAWAAGALAPTVWLIPALALDAASHYVIDRRVPLIRLAEAMDRIYPPFRKAEFAALGAPRPGRDDNPSLGTGMYSMDQSIHVLFLFLAALIAAR